MTLLYVRLNRAVYLGSLGLDVPTFSVILLVPIRLLWICSWNPACVFQSVLLILIPNLGKGQIKQLYTRIPLPSFTIAQMWKSAVSLLIALCCCLQSEKNGGKTYAAVPAEWAVYFQAFQKLPLCEHCLCLSAPDGVSSASSLLSELNHGKGLSPSHTGYSINLVNIIIHFSRHSA